MKNFWDISPLYCPIDSDPALLGDAAQKAAFQTAYLLTQSLAETDFTSDATRESILRWAAEENQNGRYIGRVRVIDVRAVPHAIRPQHIAPELFGNMHRVLIRTKSDLHDNQPVLTVDSIKLLASCGVRWIGIDTDSLDAPLSLTKEAFRAAQQLGISVMLNMNLDAVPSGDYELMALPIETSRASTFADLEISYAKATTTRAA